MSIDMKGVPDLAKIKPPLVFTNEDASFLSATPDEVLKKQSYK